MKQAINTYEYDVINRFQYHRMNIRASLPILGGTHNEEHLLQGILNNQYFMFENDMAFSIVHFVQYPMCKDLNLLISGGKLKGLLELEPDIEAFANKHGCRKLLGYGRKEWKSVGKRLKNDWKQRLILMEKEL